MGRLHQRMAVAAADEPVVLIGQDEEEVARFHGAPTTWSPPIWGGTG